MCFLTTTFRNAPTPLYFLTSPLPQVVFASKRANETQQNNSWTEAPALMVLSNRPSDSKRTGHTISTVFLRKLKILQLHKDDTSVTWGDLKNIAKLARLHAVDMIYGRITVCYRQKNSGQDVKFSVNICTWAERRESRSTNAVRLEIYALAANIGEIFVYKHCIFFF